MNLKITIIQSELHWENVDKNLAMFTDKIASVKEETDLIVLPEMFTTGFTMNSKSQAETMDGKSVLWMKQQAKNKNAVLVGSLIIAENNNYYNRLIWAQPDGKMYHYDKRHLFRMANEHEHFSAGKTRLIVELKGWKICPLICYDLRFPVWSRNKPITHHSTPTTQHPSPAFDCLIYIANWPEARKEPWSKLLEARAIENQVYVIGVNRVGTDGKDISYSGNSAIIDPKGNKISNIKEHQPFIQTIELNRKELEDFREKFPVGLDGDEFEIV
ncbi:MAG: amidohydrolase [Flavobacteriales bacterium]